MRARVLILIAAACTVAWPRGAFASSGPGVTAAPILQTPVGARAVGLGGAFTAVADDVSALYYNPAGLSTLMSREVSFMYLDAFEDEDVEYVAGATPLPWSGLVGSGYSTLAASLLFSQNGIIEVNRTNSDGSFFDKRTLSAGGDLVATLGYSERVLEHDIRLKRGQPILIEHSLGFSGKYIRSTLAETYSASAVAADVGYLVRSRDTGLSFGVSALNLGTKMKFVATGDPLPVTVRSGVAYRTVLPDSLRLPADHTLSLSADSVYLLYEKQWHVNTGFEYTVLRSYALRLGYQIHRDQGGLTFGFGAAWRGWRIDYAWAMADAFSDAHRFSFTWRFGKKTVEARESRRRPFIESMPEREDLRNIEDEVPRELGSPRRPRRVPRDRRHAVPGWIY